MPLLPNSRRNTCALVAALCAVAASHPTLAEGRGNPTLAKLVASAFMRGVLSGRLAAVLPLCSDEFNLDGQVIRGREQLERALMKVAQRAAKRRLRLRRLEILTLKEMVSRFGPPPRRISKSIGPRDLVALCRLSSRGAIIILSPKGVYWRVKVLSD